MIQSMSRKGNCWDNAPMESCLGTIKTELVHEAYYPTGDAGRHEQFAYIEGYYNRQRLHSALGYITPEQAERRWILCPRYQGNVTLWYAWAPRNHALLLQPYQKGQWNRCWVVPPFGKATPLRVSSPWHLLAGCSLQNE